MLLRNFFMEYFYQPQNLYYHLNIRIIMRKEDLRYILSVLACNLESSATSEQITKFKKKYCGMNWQQDLDKDLLAYADNTLKLERWIKNVITFMMEQNIPANSLNNESAIGKYR